MNLLASVYPTINWACVDFYEGLPWFTKIFTPSVRAQAMPDFYSFSRTRVYIKNLDESKIICLGGLIHESFHILQYMHFLNGYGLGFLRGLMVYYNAFFIKYGYRQNPFEVPAYDQELRFLKLCEQYGLTDINLFQNAKVLEKISHRPDLVIKKLTFRYKENYFLLFGSFLFCLVVALIKPIADVLVFSATGLIHLFKKKKIKQP